MQPGIRQKVLADGQAIPETRRFRQETDARPQPASVARLDPVPVKRDLACGGFNQPGEHPQRRRLASTVGTEQREDFAAGNLERRVLDGESLTEATGEVNGSQHDDYARRGLRLRRIEFIATWRDQQAASRREEEAARIDDARGTELDGARLVAILVIDVRKRRRQ